MSCYAPLTAWYTNLVVKGKRQITFQRSLAHFPAPLKLPCGKCVGCAEARAKAWGTRCYHEGKLHDQKCFITLTYDPEKIPKGHTLRKRDLQLFMKRLRKFLEPKKVRFYACGEYGSKGNRPHYHILLFGWEPDATDRKLLRKSGSDNPLYSSAALNSLWTYGFVVCGSADLRACFYVAGYIAKKLGRKWELDVTCGDGEIIRREKEFSLMSRRPGIGAGYVDRYHQEITTHDNIIVDGRPSGVPRYYDDQMQKKEYRTEKKLLEIKDSRRREAFRYRSDNLPDRRRVREKFHQLKNETFKKGDL